MRLLGLAAVLCVALATLTAPAAAVVKLQIPRAAEKSGVFAMHTCAHDESCVRHGVLNCHRKTLHIVLCRIFIRRHTVVQGRYECTRLIRLSIVPRTHRVPVTGLGRWHC
jgi:hypothetical protein